MSRTVAFFFGMMKETGISLHFSLCFQLLVALHTLSHHTVFHHLTSPEEVLALFPESFHPSLKNLITKIVLELRFVGQLHLKHSSYKFKDGQNNFQLYKFD